MTRFDPLPEKEMFESGNTVGLYEEAVRIKSSGLDSRSVIVSWTSASV